MKRKILWFLVFVLAFATLAYADFYTWEDEDGTTHITDYPPPQNKKGHNIKIYKGDDTPRSGLPDAGQAKKAPDVILFTKNECADCDKAREFLKSKKITFTEYNMDKDKNTATRRKEIDDANDVPFAVIYRSQVYGFSEAVYNRALKNAP